MITSFAEGGPARVFAEQISTAGLGDHSYLIVVGEVAALVDPQRDGERFERLLDEHGARLTVVCETHIHNDYISGGWAIAQSHGADYCLPADSGATMPHRAMPDGAEHELGDWRLRALHTPGHTPHHASYVLVGPAGPVALFSGGSMLVGAVGRTDLVSLDLTESLTHLQYRSVNRLAGELPDPTSVQPTHGAGSFCVVGEVGEAGATVSTIELERRQNPALTAADEAAFVAQQLADPTLYPAYYEQMAPLNRAGAEPPPTAPVPRLDPEALAALASDVTVVDVRQPRDFAAGHLEGSINVPLSDDVATYVGWVLPWDAPLVLVATSEHDLAHVSLQLALIGIENVVGAVTDGLAAWSAARGELASYRVASFEDLADEHPADVLDVRDPVECSRFSIPGAVNIHVSQLAEREPEVATAPWVHCATGYRAAIAASILEGLDRCPVLVLDEIERYAASPARA